MRLGCEKADEKDWKRKLCDHSTRQTASCWHKEVRLRMLPGATLPALCVELARLLLPPAKPAKQETVPRSLEL